MTNPYSTSFHSVIGRLLLWILAIQVLAYVVIRTNLEEGRKNTLYVLQVCEPWRGFDILLPARNLAC